MYAMRVFAFFVVLDFGQWQGVLFMTTAAIELFYSYAHEDEALRDQLNTHLALLQQQGLIRPWHDREIVAGTLWGKEIDAHLQSARIILLLISPDFIASDYCYGVEMQEALKRHIAGEARVIPIILRDCDWESAPFGKIHALPKNGKSVTTWSDRDTALTDVAKGIRKVVEELTGGNSAETQSHPPVRQKSGKQVAGKEGKQMAVTPTTIGAPVIKKAVERYQKELAYYREQASDELGLRAAFQNLLAEVARHVNWKISPERTMEGNIRPDGILRDEFDLRRGFWEAKGPRGNLEKEIEKKIADGYPLTNTVFENTERAILYQGKRRVDEYNLTDPKGVSDLLQQFLTYTEPDIENFEVAVGEFKERIPELATALLSIIEREQKQNRKFITAFDAFTSLCQSALNPQISTDAIKEMLVQHLLTERLFRTIFNNPDFVHRNAIAAEIETVIQALTSRSFNRQDFMKSLDRFYVAIENAAKGIENWSERQHFLNTVYERFFQGFSIKQADTLGIVYTPQEIVDFMCASVEEVLKRDFGTSIAEPGVKILDPATGTGSFIVNLVHRIPSYRLKQKYQNDLFCNEISLLPYYIASLNIEHEYYARMGDYEPFEGICFADTLELADDGQLSLFVEENTARVVREKAAQIMVVIGNPPYNVGQLNENDNNKNRKYPIVEQRIRETYSRNSKASNKNSLSDVYVKFFRWASDRLGRRDGIICFVSNNGFLEGIAFDGFRKQLSEEFTQIYHLDLGGNARKHGRGNVFGIMVGVGITILVRRLQGREKQQKLAKIFYRKVYDDQSNTEKLAFLQLAGSLMKVDWQELRPDENYIWINEGLHPEFTTFAPMGSKEGKLSFEATEKIIFRTYTSGVKTNRDSWVHDFDKKQLAERIKQFVDIYNNEVDRWRRRGSNTTAVDDFVTYNDAKIKWSRDLKLDLQRGHYAEYSEEKVRTSLYRPFCTRYLFFDRILNEEVYQFPRIFPTFQTEMENIILVVSDLGFRAPFSALACDTLPDLHLLASTDAFQCFPYYTYAEDGTNRRENITDWALKQFQATYGDQVSKWDIFHYTYAMLHHPQYRERYAENLKHDLPHIPLLHGKEAFQVCVRIGKQLMDRHLNYEQAQEYKLEWLTNEEVPFSWRVEKMRLSTDKRVVVVNESLRLGPLPPECFEYRLGNRSALEWVIDQYQVSKDKRSGIESDPNRLDDEEYIVRLVGKVVTVSVETVSLVKELAQAVTMEEWIEKAQA
jgi:predicted helicase